MIARILLILALGAADEPPVVTVAHPVRAELSDFEFLGRLEPAEAFEVRSALSGRVAKVLARAGESVKKGDVLVELERAGLEMELERAKDELKMELMLQDKKPEQEPETKTEKDLFQALRALGAVRVALARKRIAFCEAQIEQSHTAAPIAGRITHVHVKVGDLVQGGVGASLLCRVVNTGEAKVSFPVDVAVLASLHGAAKGKGWPVKVGLKGETGLSHSGRVDSIDNRADPVSGHILLTALVPNTDGKLTAQILGAEKLPTVRVRLAEATPREALLVPETSVITDAKGKRFVLLVNGKNRLEERTVKPGRLFGVYVAIDDGLTAADWVVIGERRSRTDPAAKTISPEDFLKDLRLPYRAGTLVAPLQVKLPTP